MRRIGIIAWVTLKETLRERLLYNALLVGVALFGVSLLAAQLTFVKPERILLDYGLSATSLSLAAIAILLGANLIPREIEKRTLHLLFSRPVAVFEVVAGKALGLACLLLLNTLLLGAALVACLKAVEFLPGSVSPILFAALGLAYLMSFLLACFSAMLSCAFKPALSVFGGVGAYLLGNSFGQIETLLDSKRVMPLTKAVLKGASWIFPDLGHFNLGFGVTYGLDVPVAQVALASVYALLWGALYLVIASVILKRRHLG